MSGVSVPQVRARLLVHFGANLGSLRSGGPGRSGRSLSRRAIPKGTPASEESNLPPFSAEVPPSFFPEESALPPFSAILTFCHPERNEAQPNAVEGPCVRAFCGGVATCPTLVFCVVARSPSLEECRPWRSPTN
jgi:hypothetical protein